MIDMCFNNELLELQEIGDFRLLACEIDNTFTSRKGNNTKN